MNTDKVYNTKIEFEAVPGVYFGTGGVGTKWRIATYNIKDEEESENMVFEVIKKIYNELTEEYKKKLIES